MSRKSFFFNSCPVFNLQLEKKLNHKNITSKMPPPALRCDEYSMMMALF